MAQRGRRRLSTAVQQRLLSVRSWRSCCRAAGARGGDEVRGKTMWQPSGEESVRVETCVYGEASLSGDELLALSDVSLAHRARHQSNI